MLLVHMGIQLGFFQLWAVKYTNWLERCFMFEYLFYVWPSDFWSPFKVIHIKGALVMKSIEYTEKSF